LQFLAAALAGLGGASAAKPIRVWIVGDSTSIDYTPAVRRIRAGRAVIHHDPGNAMYTGSGLAGLDAWLGTTRWDVSLFNFGPPDLKFVGPDAKSAAWREDGARQTEPDIDACRIANIGRRLRATGVRPSRHPADDPRYHAAALRPLSIEADELHALALPQLDRWHGPVNVHFTTVGSEELGRAVAEAIRRGLGRDRSAFQAPFPEAGAAQ